MNNREINELTLKRADSFRPQVQLETRVFRILYGGGYNWIAQDFPEVAQRIRDFIGKLVIERLIQELKTIYDTNPGVKQKHYAFIEKVTPNIKLRNEVYSIIEKALKA